MKAGRSTIAMLAAAALAAGACTKSAPPAAAPTATPTAGPGASPAARSGALVAYSTAASRVGGQGPDDFGGAADDLFVYDAGTGRVRRLTEDGARRIETLPRFRSRTEITFVLNSPELDRGEIWSIPVAGGRARRVLRIASAIRAYDWDLDGKRVAYLASDAEGRSVLWIYDGSAKKRVMNVSSAGGRERVESDETAVDWSPGDALLLVTDTINDHREQTMFVVRPSGVQVTDPAFGTFARWDPEGRFVYWSHWETGAWYRTDVEAEERVRLRIPGGRYRAAVSPDGRFLAYDSAGADPRTYVFDLDAQTERDLGAGVAPVWLSSRFLAVTGAQSCRDRFDDPLACEMGTAWWITAKTARLKVTGGSSRLPMATTLDADVRPA